MQIGPSSNVAFMRNVSRVVTRIYEVQSIPASPLGYQAEGRGMTYSRSAVPATRKRQLPQPEKINIYFLPPRAESVLLIEEFFSNAGLLFPYLDERTFIETYDAAERDCFKGIRRTWLILLNIVLAIASTTACNVDDGAGTQKMQAETFYQRANGLCGTQMTRETSIEVGTRNPFPNNLYSHFCRVTQILILSHSL